MLLSLYASALLFGFSFFTSFLKFSSFSTIFFCPHPLDFMVVPIFSLHFSFYFFLIPFLRSLCVEYATGLPCVRKPPPCHPKPRIQELRGMVVRYLSLPSRGAISELGLELRVGNWLHAFFLRKNAFKRNRE